MQLRTTLFLLVMAIVLTLYAVIVEADRVPEDQRQGRMFPELEPGDIISLEVIYRGADAAERLGAPAGSTEGTLRLEKTSEHQWTVRKPIEFPAFQPRVQGLTWALADLVLVSEISEGSEGYESAMGDAAVFDVRFSTRQGRSRRIEVGADYPHSAMNYIYVRVDGGPIFVTKEEFRTTFTLTLDGVRSRAMFPVAHSDALSVSVKSALPGRDKRVDRQDLSEPWVLRGEPGVDGTFADRQQVKELVDALNAWRIERFVSETGDSATQEQLDTWGFGEPLYSVSARHQNGSSVNIDIGKTFEQDGQKLVYVRARGTPYVYSGSQELLTKLAAESELFRTTKVFDFDGAEVDKIVCSGGIGGQEKAAAGFSLERRLKVKPKKARGRAGADETRADREYDWYVKALGSDEEFLADSRLVGIAVRGISELEIQKFLPPVEETARIEYDTKVQVTLETGIVHELSIGRASDDPRDKDLSMYRAARSGDGCHFLVESYWRQRLEVGHWVFHNRSISDIDPAEVFEIEVRAGATSSWTLYRVPGQGWALPANIDVRPGVVLDQAIVNSVIRGLGKRSFRVFRFEPNLAKKDYRALGIARDEFVESVSLTHVEGPTRGFRKLWVGQQIPDADDESYYARVDRPDVAIALTPEVPKAVHVLVEHLRALTASP